MANISTIEPIRYNQDLAVSTNSGLIICDESNRIDLTYVTTISKMTITTIPATLPSTTDVRFMFLTGDNWFKLDTSGNAVNVVDSKNLTIDVMQESGNTISELTALTNLPGLLTNTKYLRYAIAIIDNAPSDTIPKVKFSMTCKRSGSLAIHEFKSPQYTFTNNIYVLSSVASESLPGALAGSLKGYIWQYVDYGENYSSTVYDLANFKDIVTNKIQFRPYINTQYNEGTYSVDKITLNFLPDKKASTYEDVDEVVNIIHSINKSLSKCRVLVRHSPLENNNSIQCYVLTRSKGKKVTKEVLGKGTGSRTTYTLAHRNNIYYDSIKLYINNVEQNIAYHGVNTSTGTLSFIAPANATISCTYEYDWNFKEWKELKLDHSYEDLTNPTIINSIYRLKTNYLTTDDPEYVYMDSVRVVVNTGQSQVTVTNDAIGVGTGYVAHHSLKGTVYNNAITVYGDGVALTRDVDYILVNDSINTYVKSFVDEGVVLTADYTYHVDPPKIYQIKEYFA